MWCRRLIKGPIVNIPIKSTLQDILLPEDYDGSDDFDLVIEINNAIFNSKIFINTVIIKIS